MIAIGRRRAKLQTAIARRTALGAQASTATTASVSLPPESAPPASRRLGAVLAWLVVLGLVALMAASHVVTLVSHVDQGPLPGASLSSRIQLRALARYTVAVHALQPDSPTVIAALAKIESDAIRDDRDRLRVAVVVGEILGAAAARNRLDRVAPVDAELAGDIAVLRRLYDQGVSAITEGERTSLRQHHRWFAELALAHGAPAGDAQRVAALRPAFVLLTGYSVLGVIALLAVIAGIVLSIIAWIAFRGRRLPDRQGSDRVGSPALLEVFALYLVGHFGLGAAWHASGWDSPHTTWLNLLVLVPLLIGWLRWRGFDAASACHAFGLQRGAGAWREIGAGLVGWLTALPLLVALMLGAGLLVQRLGLPEPEHPIMFEAVSSGWAGIAGLYLLACVWAPLTEELMFRGALFHHLRGVWRLPIAVVLSSLIFAAIHPQGLVAIIPLAAVGASLAFIRAWRGSIIASMTAHAAHNAAATTWLVVMAG